MSANLILQEDTQSQWLAKGNQEFVELPRTGEYIELFDDDKVNDLYKIVSIHHLTGAHAKVVDIYAVKVGSKLDILTQP